MRIYTHECQKCGFSWMTHGRSHMACPDCKLEKVKFMIENANDWQKTCLEIYDEIEDDVDEINVRHSSGG